MSRGSFLLLPISTACYYPHSKRGAAYWLFNQNVYKSKAGKNKTYAWGGEEKSREAHSISKQAVLSKMICLYTKFI